MTAIALASSAAAHQGTRRITTAIFAVFIVWGAAVALLAARGFFAGLYLPYVAVIVVAGIVLPALAYLCSRRLQRYFAVIGLYPLTILHVWRIPAALVFFAYGVAGQLPMLFWALAGVGDFIAGLYAARLLFGPKDDRFYWRFHLFGFADFVVAVGAGLTFTLLGDPRMAAIAMLPLALIPLFGVGISGASHLIAFHQLARRSRAS